MTQRRSNLCVGQGLSFLPICLIEARRTYRRRRRQSSATWRNTRGASYRRRNDLRRPSVRCQRKADVAPVRSPALVAPAEMRRHGGSRRAQLGRPIRRRLQKTTCAVLEKRSADSGLAKFRASSTAPSRNKIGAPLQMTDRGSRFSLSNLLTELSQAPSAPHDFLSQYRTLSGRASGAADAKTRL